MRRAVKTTVLSLAALALAAGCSHKEEPTSSGDPRLDGTYERVGTEWKGEMVKDAENKVKYVFTGNKMIVQSGKSEDVQTISCDTSKNPAEITISKKEASGKVDAFHGIYKLEGGTLTICIRKTDNPADRPGDFKTSKNSSAMLLVLKRE